MLVRISFLFLTTSCFCQDVKLKQVVVLSRHNIRTPLTANLERYTPNKWPDWEEKPGYLTKKGKLLESYMGDYFQEWLNKERLLPDGCPEKDTIFVYANTKDRTKESAKAFVKAAFRDCDVRANFKNTTEMDPLFNPIIHNNTNEFKQNYYKEMDNKLSALNLTASFKLLDEMIDINNSLICKEEGYCDLLNKNDIIYEIEQEPNINGPLNIGNAVVDAFIMSYFNEKPLEQVAWGKITSLKQWELLTQITKQNQNVRFNLADSCKDFAGPLLKYMADIFTLENDVRKFILLIGHDSNLSPIISALDFKSFELRNQFEPCPIGGKLAFQRWTDGEKDFLKIEYIYNSWSQIRDGVKINLENPPVKVLMEINGCKIDENGLCPWNDFINIMKKYL